VEDWAEIHRLHWAEGMAIRAIARPLGISRNTVKKALASHEPPNWAEDRMIALFLLLVIVAMVLGIVGVVAKGLLYLLFIGIVVFLGALLLGALRMRRRPGRGSAR
jgi:hypothetical protein